MDVLVSWAWVGLVAGNLGSIPEFYLCMNHIGHMAEGSRAHRPAGPVLGEEKIEKMVYGHKKQFSYGQMKFVSHGHNNAWQ